MANTIDPSLLISSAQNTQKKTGSDSLGKDDFLKILMTQLQNQDPLNPMQDKDFVAQMATFSSLEQLTNMNTTLTSFVNNQTSGENSLLQASTLIGKKVTFMNENNEQTANVKSVSQKDGKILFQLDDTNSTAIDSSQITKIE